MPSYRCQFVKPSADQMLRARRAAAAADARVKPNKSGAARSESSARLVASAAAKSKRVTRALHDGSDEAEAPATKPRRAKTTGEGEDKGTRSGLHTEEVDVRDPVSMTKLCVAARLSAGLPLCCRAHPDLFLFFFFSLSLALSSYRAMKSVPTADRLVTKRSHVHGWGLFVKLPVPRHDMIVEYMGETIRGTVSDLRERLYDEQQVGSCYLFRLGSDEIVDATKIGSMARFINHSCLPNAYAKVNAALHAPGSLLPLSSRRCLSAGCGARERTEEDRVLCAAGFSSGR